MLFMCPPLEEGEYIRLMKQNLDSERYAFIDLNELLVRFVDENEEEIMLKYELLQNSSNQIFKLPPGEPQHRCTQCHTDTPEPPAGPSC